MIRREQVHARVLEMIAAADKQIAAERGRPQSRQAKTAVGRHSRQPRPTLDVDTSETHVLHEGESYRHLLQFPPRGATALGAQSASDA